MICLPASRSPSDLPPATCCWTVFIVSNGASIVLEQAAARPEASVFLSPSVTADDGFLGVVVVGAVVEDALLVRPPRGMVRTSGLAGWMPLPLAMLNDLADAGTVREQKRNRESRSAAFILEKILGLDMAQAVDPTKAAGCWLLYCISHHRGRHARAATVVVWTVDGPQRM